jgi:hypothetical protein
MTTPQQLSPVSTPSPTDDYDEGEYRQGDNCVMCMDYKHFTTVTLPTIMYPIHHAGAVHMANQVALSHAARDSVTGCSLSKEELFIFHFAKAYPVQMATLRGEACAKFIDECYARMETDLEYRRQCCDYHLDGLHCVIMTRQPFGPGTY